MLVGVPLGHPGQLLTMPTTQPRSLPCPAAVVSPLDMAHAMAHVADARAGAGPGRSPCISITFLALAASLCLLGIGTWQMRLFAGSQPTRRSSLPVKTTLALFMVLIYGMHHLLRQPLPSDCEWQQWLTCGFPPAVPLLSALAFLFHLAPICCAASSLSSFSLSSLLTRDRQR